MMTDTCVTGKYGSAAGLTSLPAVLGDIERIAHIERPVIRNLWITQSYHWLMGLLSDVVGGDNANWSTFATWASKTAGQSIRGEEIPREFRQLLVEEARVMQTVSRFARALPGLPLELDPLALPRAIVAEVSQQIAIGNLLVYRELAPLFAQFWGAFRDPTARDEQALQGFVAKLTSGATAQGGQDDLKLAFTSYFAAARTTSPKERAEFTLYGNLLIGLHEQTRLQDYIAGALDAPFAERTYARLLAAQPDWLEAATRPLFNDMLGLLRRELEDRWERLATRYLMRLALPDGQALSLGEDIPVCTRPFPNVLDPLADAKLRGLVQSYDSNLDSLRGSAARNWTELNNRMAFIADLFRSRQQDRALFEPPFSNEQYGELVLGRVPSGPL